ncbi:MAG TPA: hypothetical protein PKA06_10025, partial [Gemmatales bacterium]|nr:hypothetical protein [Gemmatales bacterium]
KAVELTYMEVENKKAMAKRILGEYPEKLEEMLGFIDKFPDLQETPAQFQERCAQIALACFWKEKEALKLAQKLLSQPDGSAASQREVEPRTEEATIQQELQTNPVKG